jgi:hypothetical protein
MPATTIVNALTVVHRASQGQALSGPPDVCLTPSPSGPVPIPYVNVAMSQTLANGTTTVAVDGNPIAIKSSEFAMSTGDEPGVAGGGVVSAIIKGKAKFANFSFDVSAEGESVCRLTDPMTMNGNAPNTGAPAELQPNIPGVGEGKMDILCRIFCWCDAGNSGGDFVKKVPGGPQIA